MEKEPKVKFELTDLFDDVEKRQWVNVYRISLCNIYHTLLLSSPSTLTYL